MLSVPAIGCAGWQEAGGRPLAPNPGDSPGGNALTNLNSPGWQFKFVLEVTVTENGMQCCAATILNLNFKVEGQPDPTRSLAHQARWAVRLSTVPGHPGWASLRSRCQPNFGWLGQPEVTVSA